MLIYLATPYSKWPAGIHMAFVEASKLTARLLEAGHKAYSPITHTHPMATYGNIDPYDHDIWMPFDTVMMEKADMLMVATFAGWEQSKGIQMEIEFFKARSKPIVYVDPETLNVS